jgi:hypothetical protein
VIGAGSEADHSVPDTPVCLIRIQVRVGKVEAGSEAHKLFAQVLRRELEPRNGIEPTRLYPKWVFFLSFFFGS